jgi:hypothetical protein
MSPCVTYSTDKLPVRLDQFLGGNPFSCSCFANSLACLYRCLIKSTCGFGVAMPFFDYF